MNEIQKLNILGFDITKEEAILFMQLVKRMKYSEEQT
jgi:hypothetical protein